MMTHRIITFLCCLAICDALAGGAAKGSERKMRSLSGRLERHVTPVRFIVQFSLLFALLNRWQASPE